MTEIATLRIGMRHCERMVVEDRHTVPKIAGDWPGFADMPPVLATAIMIGFIEQTCIQALRPYLMPGQHSVGTLVKISHSAPTPVGLTVRATVELEAIKGLKLRFKVLCEDETGPIGNGTHERVIIDVERFMRLIEDKKASI